MTNTSQIELGQYLICLMAHDEGATIAACFHYFGA